ncbi:lactate racemase domain-containing protein [Chloroflexota bacterium]
MQTVMLPQLAWFDPRNLDISFPDNWRVEVHNMAGYDRPALSSDQIASSLQNMIDTPPIRELAKGKEEVVIIFDDITRVTRPSKIVPFVLNELAQAGISDRNIRFVAALGSHGPMNRVDFVKKLGEDVVARYPVYNHNAFHNCVHVGTTSYGNDIHINGEVMNCDFKIAIGSVTPHPGNVFGGGAKIMLPGVSSIDTIFYNHSMTVTEKTAKDYDANPRRLDKVEATKLAELDVVIQCIVNLWGDTVALYAGTEPGAHAAAVQDARKHYITQKAKDVDIVVANAYAKSSEESIAYRNTAGSIKENGGDHVLISNTPAGQVAHYLFGKWGTDLWGKLQRPIRIGNKVNHLIQYNEYPDLANCWFKPHEKVMHASRWDDVIAELEKYHGDGTRIAVYPSGDIAYFE